MDTEEFKIDMFNTIEFAIDYARKIHEIQGTLKVEDFIQCFCRIYRDAFALGRQDVLKRYMAAMVLEIIDDIDEDDGE